MVPVTPARPFVRWQQFGNDTAPLPPPHPTDVRVIKSLAAGRGGRVRDEQESATVRRMPAAAADLLQRHF